MRNDGLLILVGVVGVDFVMVIMGGLGVALACGIADVPVVFDKLDREKGSDLVLVRSTKSDRSSTGTTRSGLVPPI